MNVSATVNGKPIDLVNPAPLAVGEGALVVTVSGWAKAVLEVGCGEILELVDGGGASRFPLAAKLGVGTHVVKVSREPLTTRQAVSFVVVIEPAPKPAPKPEPTPAPPAIIDSPGQRISHHWNGDGKTYRHTPTAGTRWPSLIETAAEGLKISNATLITKPGDQFGIGVWHNRTVVEGIKFADVGGYLVKLAGAGSILRDITASRFEDYAIYAERARDFLVERCNVDGGSSGESVFRVDEASGTFRNCRVNYTTADRRACLRGSMTGRVEGCEFRGGIVGLNPLGGMDGGQAYGFTKFLVGPKGKIVTATNSGETWAAAVALINHRERDRFKIARAAASLVKVNGTPVEISDQDVRNTLARRVTDLAKVSDVTFVDTLIDFGLRWEPGTRYRYLGGEIIGSSGVIFPGMGTTQYPEKAYVMPGDVMRKAPDVVFEGTKLGGGKFHSPQGASFIKCTLEGKPFGNA